MPVEAFRIRVADEILVDLRERLRRARFAEAATGGNEWAAGADPGYLRELTTYWADGFDWRAAEAALNDLPQQVAMAGGRRVHFVWLRSGNPDALPLVLTHGWPGSFMEMLPTARLLAGEFDVVVPSLPGFIFSEPIAGLFTRRRVAGIWHELMTGVLGYRRFGAYGSDIGGGVRTWLGALFPGEVAGVHVATSMVGGDRDNPPLTDEELDYFRRREAYDLKDAGYSEIMCTKPDTIAAALLDSPVGLAAWIVDKLRAWSDCSGDLERRWNKDSILTVLTLYWATASIGTSFRQYYDYDAHNQPVPVISVPAAVTLATEPMYAGFPRSLAERTFSDLRHWSTPGRGGHFIAHEEPEPLATELSNFFRPLQLPRLIAAAALARVPGPASAPPARGRWWSCPSSQLTPRWQLALFPALRTLLAARRPRVCVEPAATATIIPPHDGCPSRRRRSRSVIHSERQLGSR